MRGTRSFRNTGSDGLDTCTCAALCWTPILMVLLSFIAGISCFFFMSMGGLVLGIIYCTVGCALAFVPFGLHRSQERFWAILSIVSIVLLMLLIFASFGYIVWLLVQSSRAHKEMDSAVGSPFIVPLLGMYAQKAGFISARRLQESTESIGVGGAPLFDMAVMDSHIPSGNQALPLLIGAGVEAPSTTTSTSTSSQSPGDGENKDEQPRASDEHAREVEAMPQIEAENLVDSLNPTSSDVPTVPAPGEMMKELLSIAKRKADEIISGESSFYPTVLRQSWESKENIFVSTSDLECLQNMDYESEALPKSEYHLRALLDWGLFCGYTSYTIGPLRKWPVSCSDDCNFGNLNFSRNRDSEEKTDEQAKEFLEELESMTPAQAEACTLLAIVTTCKIREQNLDSAAMTAMYIALVVSITLFLAAIKCLVDCIQFLRKESKRLERVAPHHRVVAV